MNALGRRALMAGTAVALAAADGALNLARGSQPGPTVEEADAELLAVCAEFHRHHAAVVAMAGDDTAGISAANGARWDAAEVVERIAAVTHAGQAAKAEVALVLLEENSAKSPDGDISLAISVLRDVARPGSLSHTAATLSQPANLDASLLLACADFQLACVEQRRRHVTDAESDAMSDAFYATLARVEALHPTTPAGLRAKVLAARTALMDQIHNFIDKEWREEASPEERVVMDTLQHILDGVAL
jgi:hypothetical protein